MSDSVGLPVALGLGVLLIIWYWAGNEVMRRRAHRLAVWSRRVVDPLGGKQSIRWLGGQAFRIEVEGSLAPFASLVITGLVESWDTPFVWAWNRLHGRRDMISLQATLRAQPLWGLEIYRAGTLLAGDSRHFARQAGWSESPLDDLSVFGAGEAPLVLAADLLGLLQAERARLLRLGVRRRGQHLTVALNVPDPDGFDPENVTRLAERLADRLTQPR